MASNVIFQDRAYSVLNSFLNENRFSKIFVLVDGNTHQFCLPAFLSKVATSLSIEIIETETGEEHKNLETCSQLWEVLSELEADRKSLLINLGGGVITDLGGFTASCFKRGIAFVHVPTTLLAMVDAAIGGKTGVNLGSLKNQVGVINEPKYVLVDPFFLKTLPSNQIRSGLAEMLKHGLICDETYWENLTKLKNIAPQSLGDFILPSVKIKEQIVEKDPKEQNIRKSLNFGHTLGHAIESYFLEHPKKEKLLHGEAVAAGMVLETFISSQITAFPENKLEAISRYIFSHYEKIKITPQDFEKILALLKHDKKNERGTINFVLLKNIGTPVIDCVVPREALLDAFNYYIGYQ